MTWNDTAADETIAHRLRLLRFEGGTVRTLLAHHDRAYHDVRALLTIAAQRPLTPDERTRLAALGRTLTRDVVAMGRAMTAHLDAATAEAADAERAFVGDLLGTLP
jgi:hypothetical protein